MDGTDDREQWRNRNGLCNGWSGMTGNLIVLDTNLAIDVPAEQYFLIV